MAASLSKTIKSNGLNLACLAAAAVLAVLVVVRLTGSLVDASQTRQVVARAFTQGGKDPNEAKPSLDIARTTANALKKKNLFVKEQPKEHPIKQVDGILGNEALIQSKWYKAGDKIGEAKILSITATGVVAEWEGKTRTFSPMTAGAPEPPGPPQPRMAKPPEPNKPARKPDANEVKVAPQPKAEDPLAFIGVPLSEKARSILLRLWDKVPEDQKEKAKEQWNKMSDEQKQQALQALENMPEEQVQQAIQSMANR